VERYTNWIYRLRYVIVIMTVVLIGFAAYGGKDHQKNFKTDYRNFFSQENPQLLSFEAMQNIYSKNDAVLIVLEPEDGNVFTREILEIVEVLSYPTGELSAWKIPHATRVDSIANFQNTYAMEDDLIVEDLVQNASELTQEQIDGIREVALREPLLMNRLITAKGNVTGINITVELPGNSNTEVIESANYARDLAEKIRARYPHVNVYLTGMVMMNNAFPEASKKDWGGLVPFMFLVIAIVMGLMLRSVSGTITTVLVIFFTIMSAMGLAGWLKIWLTAPSASAPIIIMTLAVADCVHILVTLFHSMRKGDPLYQSMVHSLKVNMQPVFLTSLTTSIGFLSMNFSDAPPFRDLGNITAMGVGIAFILSVTFLPALMFILPVRIKQSTTRGSLFMDRLAWFTIQRRNPIIWVTAIGFLVLAAFIPRIELNDEFVKYFDEEVEFRSHTDFTMNNLTGIYAIQYSLSAGESGGVNNPEFLKRVEAFTDWYRQQPNVVHVNTITDTFKRLNKNMHADNEAYYKLPQSRELAAQYLLLYEMSLPFGLDLNNTINIDKSATRVIVTLENMDNIRIREMEKRAQQWLKEHPPSMAERGASPTIMFAYIAERNIKTMLKGTAFALLLIAIVLIIALKSFKFGLISLIPNFFPAVMGFGIWAIFVGQVGLALSIVTAMTLGIVVDDTVHFLSKYLRARRELDTKAEDAVRYAFTTVGTALWITSFTLVAGFLVLSTSAFELNQGMGRLTAIVISIALIADLTFLPALLMKLERSQDEEGENEQDKVKEGTAITDPEPVSG
jgi:predicted RND superfamily exporter protein